MAYIGSGISRFNTADELTVTGDATIDTTTLVVDSTNNRVGIGTVSPERQLHVEGAGLIKNTSGEALFKLQAANNSNSILELADTDDGNVGRIQYEHDNNAMLLYTNDSERLRIDSSGSVGIGTSSPSSLLDVDKSQNAETNIELTNTNVGSAAQVRTKYTTDGGLFTVGKVSDAHAYSGAAYLWNVDNTGMLFATNDTERMRLDASGNLLVGTTSTISSNTNGGLYVSNAGYTSLFNRESSAGDGNIMLFAKGGTTVGLIGVYGSRIYAGTGDVGLWFNDQSDYIAPINAGTSALRDAAIDIGHSAYRFKDLYLSGGAYIGGTGSVNYLDDYEEGSGSFTSVTDSSGNALTTSTNVYYYTKVGRFVQLEIRVQLSSATTGEVRLNGPPFTLSSNDTELGVVIDRNVFAASSSQIRLRAGTNNQYMYGVVTYRTS